MNKCVKCGNEILTGDIHWEMGLCNNCYNELYKDHKTHISLDKMWLKLAQDFRDENEKLQDKVADLEAKFAESEKSKESYRLQNEQHHLQLLQFYSRLGVEAFGADIHEKALETLMTMKEQLAEKDIAIENWQTMYESVVQTCHNDKEEIERLNRQLAEKEKENNELEFIVEEIEQFAWEQLNNDNFDKYKAYDEMYTKIKQLTKNSPYEEHNQDKISFAVEKLEQVKEEILPEISFDVQKEFVEKEIDNQIKQLKEMK